MDTLESGDVPVLDEVLPPVDMEELENIFIPLPSAPLECNGEVDTRGKAYSRAISATQLKEACLRLKPIDLSKAR